MLEIFKAKGILVGSSTINNGILTSIAAILEEIKGLKFKNKSCSLWKLWLEWRKCKIISNILAEAKFEIVMKESGLNTPQQKKI